MTDISAIIAGAKRPERTLELCLRADLVAELEDANRSLAGARDKKRESLADAGDVDEIQATIDRIKDEARAATVVFRFRALNHYEVQRLMADLPPREGNVMDKRVGYNADALTWHLFKSCCYEPDLSDDDLAALLGPVDEVGNGVLSPSQWQRIDDTLSALNFPQRDLPF